MSTRQQTPAPKRKRGGSPSPSSSATATSSTTMSGYGLSLLSSVTKSVTKRMRLGYDYALGSGTTNGDSDPSGAAASGGADAGRGAHHKSPVPRREFGSPRAVGVGGIGSPPFASAGLPASAAAVGASAGASASASAGGGKKVGFTPFSDGKKTADGKLLAVSVVALVGTSCQHTHVVGIIFTFSHMIACMVMGSNAQLDKYMQRNMSLFGSETTCLAWFERGHAPQRNCHAKICALGRGRGRAWRWRWRDRHCITYMKDQ